MAQLKLALLILELKQTSECGVLLRILTKMPRSITYPALYTPRKNLCKIVIEWVEKKYKVGS